MATITLQGTTINTNGELPKVGAAAPAFRLTNKDLADVGLGDFKGKVKLLNIVPSLDTPVCATSTKKFICPLQCRVFVSSRIPNR